MSKIKLYHGNDVPTSIGNKHKRAGTFGAMYQNESPHHLNLKHESHESKKTELAEHKKGMARKMKNKFYVGHSNEPHKREVFASKTVPTKESHPQYGHVRSGFKTKKQAENEKNYY